MPSWLPGEIVAQDFWTKDSRPRSWIIKFEGCVNQEIRTLNITIGLLSIKETKYALEWERGSTGVDVTLPSLSVNVDREHLGSRMFFLCFLGLLLLLLLIFCVANARFLKDFAYVIALYFETLDLCR